jgi:crossover junction endodeoxyribonuclease RuvC
MSSRLVNLHSDLEALLQRYQPDQAAVERLFFQKNVTTAISVGQARGVVLLALAQAGLTIEEYTPQDIKMAVTGYGAADKGQMQRMVKMLLTMEALPKPDDAADALAVAICHANSAALQARIEEIE